MAAPIHPHICIKQTVDTPPSLHEESVYDFFERPPKNAEFKERVYSVDELAKKIGGKEFLTPSVKAAAQSRQELRVQTLLPYHHIPAHIPTISFLAKIAQYYEKKYKIIIAIRSMSEAYAYIAEQEKQPGPFAQGLIIYIKDHFHVIPLLLHKTREQTYDVCIMDSVCSVHILKEVDLQQLSTHQEGRSVWVSEGARQADNHSCRLESLTLLKYLLLWIQRHPDKLWSEQVRTVKETVRYPFIHFFYLPAMWALASQSTCHITESDHPHTTVINNKGTTYASWIQKYRAPIEAHTTIIDPLTSEKVEHSHPILLNTFLVQKTAKYVAKLL